MNMGRERKNEKTGTGTAHCAESLLIADDLARGFGGATQTREDHALRENELRVRVK